MMTIANARQLVGQAMGLRDFDGSISAYRELSAAQQIELTQRLFIYIEANPASFTPGQLETVQVEKNRIQAATPEDASFDWEQFGEELGENVSTTLLEPVATVGRGVSTTVSLIGTLLPVAAVLAVLIYSYPYIKSRISP